MKKITLLLFALFTCWQINAQSIVIGTGTGTTTSTGSDPIDGYYESFRYQVVYTAAELSASLTPYDEITALGFSIAGDYAGGNLIGYTIKMGHTSATNSATHDSSPTTVVKSPFNYNPTVTAAGVFDMITFDNNFVWNGVDNVLVEICSDGPNAFVSPYGQVRMTTMTNGSRNYRVDGGVSCNVNTATTNGNRPNIQFNYIEGTPPSCLAPNALGATNILATSAQLSWNENGNATVWNIQYGISGFSLGSGTIVSGVSNNYLLTGLSPNTQYQYYVQADCGGAQSTWSGPFSYLTLCEAFTIPFFEGFNSTSTTEACWTKLNVNADGDAWDTNYTTNPFEGNQSAVIYTDFNAGANNDWLISPTITLTGNQRLKFHYRVESAGEPNDFELLLSSTGTTPASFTNTLIANTSYSNTTYIERVVDLSAYTGDVNIAWHVANGGLDGWRLYIDNVIVEEIPSCVEPNTIIASNVSSSSVDLSWTDGSGGQQFDYEYAIQAPGTGVPTGAGAQVGDVTVLGEGFDINGDPLLPNTAYEVYVRADCGGGDFSTWVGPITFRTLCEAFTVPFSEGFNSTSPTESCWTKLNINADGDAWDTNYTTNPFEGNQCAVIYTDFNAGANDDWLISPTITLTGNQRLKFHYRVQSAGEPNDFELLLSTTGTAPASFTNTLIANTSYSNVTYVEQIVDLSAYTGNVNIAWHVPNGGLDGWRLYIDNVIIEDLPTVAPSCASNVVATPHPTCGNFANSITWDATPAADGYYVTIGSSSGANDIANSISLSSTTLSYSFTGAINTTYFYTIVPFNANGSATGCTEQSFTTNVNGCYCVSAPTSVDGVGITNVQIVSTNFANTVSTSPVYNDHTATPVDVSQGINNNVQISFNTSIYDYNTVIWVDFNDNYNLEPSEIVYTGLSSSTSPNTLNASFVMPLTAPLGQHRMRIVATDALQNPANPCYSGTYGETADFTVNVVAASCTPPSAQASVVPACTTNQFFIDVNVSALGSGTPSISDGITSWPVSAIGVVNVGPFASGSSVSLTLLHGSDSTCNLPLGSLSYTCPPANDNCADAQVLTPGGVFADNSVVGTNIGATSSNAETAPGCASYNGSDVWYQVTVPNSGSITIETNNNTSAITDTGIAVYSGSCGNLTLIECDDDDSLDGNFSLISLTNRTPGDILFIRVWEYGGDIQGTFRVSAYDASLSSDLFDNSSFIVYPNPVKDVLNISYATEISSVRVINMIGQEVLSKNVNATSSQVDMSQLSAGTYIVNVTLGETIKTLKVVKQ